MTLNCSYTNCLIQCGVALGEEASDPLSRKLIVLWVRPQLQRSTRTFFATVAHIQDAANAWIVGEVIWLKLSRVHPRVDHLFGNDFKITVLPYYPS